MKESKKAIRQTIEDAFQQAISKFALTPTSKKTQKLIGEASKKISEQVKLDLKKKSKKEAKLSKIQRKEAKRSEA